MTTAAAPDTVLGPDDLDPVLSTTARLGAAAPFSVVSDGQFLYLFRQSVTLSRQVERARIEQSDWPLWWRRELYRVLS